MKRKKFDTPYLDFYEKYMKNKYFPQRGLCNVFPEGLQLFEPSKKEFPEYWRDGFTGYWGYDGDHLTSSLLNMSQAFKERGITEVDAVHKFTPMRQTIVLFLSCMNDEY